MDVDRRIRSGVQGNLREDAKGTFVGLQSGSGVKTLAVAALLVLAGCGQPGPAPDDIDSGSRKTVVGPEDKGRTVTLTRGDVLTVALDESRAGWVLAAFPRKSLTLASPAHPAHQEGATYQFEATAPGAGVIVIVDFTSGSEFLSCGDRLRTRQIPACPLAGGVDAGSLPARAGAFTINVVVE